MRRLLFLAILTVLPRLSLADTPYDSVRDLLDAGDTRKLEALMGQLHQTSLQTQEFETLRQINGRLFSTTNPDWHNVLDAWQKEFPRSAYVLAAQYWRHTHVAFLKRGTEIARDTNSFAMSLFASTIEQAYPLADQSYAIAPDYAPASDAALNVRKFDHDFERLFQIASDVFAVAPTEHSLQVAIYAASPRWGGGVEYLLELCDRFADQIPEYSAIHCQLDLGLSGHFGEQGVHSAYDHARDILGKIPPEDQLNYLYRYNREAKVIPVELAAMVALHSNWLGHGAHTRTYLGQATILAERTGDDSYFNESRAKLAKYVAQRLQEDPFNPDFLYGRIEQLQVEAAWDPQHPSMVEARSVWENLLPYNGHQPSTWELGAELVRSPIVGLGVFEEYPFMANQVVLSQEKAQPLASLLSSLDTSYQWTTRDSTKVKYPEADLKRAQDWLACPILRVAHLFLETCKRRVNADIISCKTFPPVRELQKAKELEVTGLSCPPVAPIEPIRLGDLPSFKPFDQLLASPF